MTNNIFNAEKTVEQYLEKVPDLFLGVEPGLFNTVYKPYPKLWELYKQMKSLDWDEGEFDFSQCNLEFKTCSKSDYELMIRTIAWQWEADTFASSSITPILGNVITDSSLWALTQRIGDNEVVHASTYSEIVRMSFDDGAAALKDVLEVKESLERLDTIAKVFSGAKILCLAYASGDKSISKQQVYDQVFLVYCALFMLERIQFMASFAITFTLAATGLFQAIGKAVQKIAQDELEVHVATDMEVLRIELQTERGKEAFARLKPFITKMFVEVVESELTWTEYIFSEGRSLTGANVHTLSQWVLFNARPVAKYLNLETEYKFPTTNPMPHLVNWLNISDVQAAPQEQDNNQYKVNMVVRDDADAEFDVDF